MYNYTLNNASVLPHDTNALNVQTAAADYAKAQDVDADDVFQLKRYRSAKTELNGLVTDCSVFETTELAATHARLYQLLTRAYSYYVTMKTDSDAKVRSEYKKALKDFIAERGHKFLKSSSDMHRVVKCVFGGGRRRVSAYSLALNVALVSGAVDSTGKATAVAPAELANWLAEQGGVEEVRMATKKAAGAIAGNDKAAAWLADKVLMTIRPDVANMAFGVDDNDKHVLLLAVYRPTGELEIKALVKDDAAVKAAHLGYYKENKELVEAASEAANDTKVDAIGEQLAKLAA